MGYTNSSLVNYTQLSPNRNSPRDHAIDRLTIHCYVGQVSVESMAGWLCTANAKASANYGIGNDGRIGLFVPEKDRSWCSSSSENDNRAITIECASDTKHPYAINDNVYKKLITLCVDICKRNGKKTLIWFGDKEKTLTYNPKSDEMVMTVHRWFANKACPGDYIYERLGTIAKTVTEALGGKVVVPTIPTGDKYVVRLSFDQPKTQTNSFNNLDYAKAEADRHPGYSVYEASTGKVVYTASKETGYSSDEWIRMISPIAQELAKKNNILPSVVIAQTCLETGFGKTDLTRKYNIVGMKADLINNTWKDYTVWDGTKYSKVTPEYYNGQLVHVTDNFRVYKTFRECLEDYEQFLLHVQNNKGLKYARIAGVTDPAKVINIIRIGTGTNTNPEGYCTDPNYETKILNLIKQYNLTQYDTVMAKPKEVKKEPVKSNIKADDVVKAAKEMNTTMMADVKAGKNWSYTNKKSMGRTFELSRSSNYYRTNCNKGVIWAHIKAGILPENVNNFYGKNGKFVGTKTVNTYYDVLDFGGKKTAAQLVASGDLHAGDIISYTNMVHTNMCVGGTQFFDSGHAWAKGSGEGAKFTKWIGNDPYASCPVGQVLRIKGTSTMYRVRVGKYKLLDNAIKMKATVKEKTGFDCFHEQNGTEYWVYCGSFNSRINANERVVKLAQVNIPAEIDEV